MQHNQYFAAYLTTLHSTTPTFSKADFAQIEQNYHYQVAKSALG